MKESSFEGWDFNDVWFIDIGEYNYPMLKGENALPCSPVLFAPPVSEINLFALKGLTSEQIFALRDKMLILVYAKAPEEKGEYILCDYGFVFSYENSIPEINGNSSVRKSSENRRIQTVHSGSQR